MAKKVKEVEVEEVEETLLKDITFDVPLEEYEEANTMAKSKGFNSIEECMRKKYQTIMRVYRSEL